MATHGGKDIALYKQLINSRSVKMKFLKKYAIVSELSKRAKKSHDNAIANMYYSVLYI